MPESPRVTTIAQTEVVSLAKRFGADVDDPVLALRELGARSMLAGHAEVAQQGDPKAIDWGGVYDTLFAEVFSSPDDSRDIFKRIIRDANPKINWAHLALGELAAEGWIATTITTNFDLLALTGYARAGVIPVVSDGIESLDRIDPHPEYHQLIQINGSIHSYRLRNDVASLDGVRASEAAISCFRTLYQHSRVFVVIGYEGRESQIMGLLKSAAQSFPDKHVFWCLHSSDPGRLSARAREFMSCSANARLLVDQDADVFFYELCRELGVHAPIAIRDPLGFHEKRLEEIFDASQVARHVLIEKSLAELRARLGRLRACEEGIWDSFPGGGPADASDSVSDMPSLRVEARPTHQRAWMRSGTASGTASDKNFEAMVEEFEATYTRGRDFGDNQLLLDAIGMCDDLLRIASTPDQRGRAHELRGNALSTLGEREPGPARLTEAVEAFQAALEEMGRDRAPFAWARRQMNLGKALFSLSTREPGTARLTEAVEAFGAALEEWTRDRVPLLWARAQMNLGVALQTLGERETGTARLTEAVEAFRAALEERTRDRVPLDWALIQVNLGNALAALGTREPSTARLTEAVAATRAALEERTRDRAPLDWARAQANLGNVLLSLGAQEPGTARLTETVAACRAALEELTRDQVPLEWASATGNLGLALVALAERTDDLPLARTALENLTVAEAVLREDGYIPWADHFSEQIPAALALIARLSAPPGAR